MHHRRHRQQLIALVAFAAAGCVQPFKTPSAYNDQRYLCDPASADAFASGVTACRSAGQPCAGVISYKGTLQDEPITVESVLTTGIIQLVQPPGAPDQKLDEVTMTGRSPYFFFSLHLKSVGGLVEPPITSTRVLQIDGAATAASSALDDDLTAPGILLESGGESAEQNGQTSTGTFTFTLQSRAELKGTFHGAFGNAQTDLIDGCFDFFPQTVSVVPEASH